MYVLIRGRYYFVQNLPQVPTTRANHDLDATQAALRSRPLIGPALGPVSMDSVKGF